MLPEEYQINRKKICEEIRAIFSKYHENYKPTDLISSMNFLQPSNLVKIHHNYVAKIMIKRKILKQLGGAGKDTLHTRKAREE